MRYEKAELLLKLALALQSSRVGLSLDEMAEMLEVGRRTAMRMRDALERLFPQLERVPSEERVHRWRLPPGTLDKLVGVNADDMAALEAAAALFQREGRGSQAERLRHLIERLRVVMKPEQLRRMDPDLEALVEAEGVALRAGPRPMVPSEHVGQLRDAILGCYEVEMRYFSRSSQAERTYRLRPYALLYGHRHYVLAQNLATAKVQTFSLTNIRGLVVTEVTFTRPEDFDVAAYTARSFGVYQEAPQRIVWRFSPRAADAAREFQFHPDQVVTEQEDGSLMVVFHAGGLLEMAWHLLSWGQDVAVLEPPRLAEMIADVQKDWGAFP